MWQLPGSPAGLQNALQHCLSLGCPIAQTAVAQRSSERTRQPRGRFCIQSPEPIGRQIGQLDPLTPRRRIGQPEHLQAV